MNVHGRLKSVAAAAHTGARSGKRRVVDWEEYLDRKVLLDRARKGQIEALKEIYNRYGLRLLLAEERLSGAERRALRAHIAGPAQQG